ncbi:MAG TPA: hypothetical protein VJ890_15125 [Vineibacter sp.]|nr:hypothetical protein [Vineibacter sp.]
MADAKISGLAAIGGTVGDAFADLLPYIDGNAAPAAANVKVSPFDLFVARSRKYSWFFDDLYSVGLIVQSASGAGAQVYQNNASDVNHPGVVGMDTGTDTTGAAGISSFNAYAFRPGGGRIKFLCYLKTPSALSDGTNRYSIFAGLTRSSLAYAPSEWLGVRYRDDVNGSPAKWQLVCRNGGSESVADIGVIAAADTWYRIEIDINAAANSVTASVNGTVSPAVTTNIPTAESFFTMQIVKALGTTNRSLNADGYGWAQNFTTAR